MGYQSLGGCFSACAVILWAAQSNAALVYPFIDPIRAEVVAEIVAMQETNGASGFEYRLLVQARSIIDRRSRASLANDAQVLGSVAGPLLRSANRAIFSPLLATAAQSYFEVIVTDANTAATNLSRLPPSTFVSFAHQSLNLVFLYLDQAASASDLLSQTRLISRAVARLDSVRALIDRIGRDVSPSPSFTAYIRGDLFQSDAPPSVIYNPGAQVLTISATQIRGLERRSIVLNLSRVVPGTSSHLLGDSTTDNYAIYTRQETNTVGFTSSTGSAIITVNVDSEGVNGTFSFIGVSRSGLDAPLLISGGRFQASIQ